jgi:hypothetical protein
MAAIESAIVHLCRRVASHVSMPFARRNTHAASARAPITVANRLIHVSLVVAECCLLRE